MREREIFIEALQKEDPRARQAYLREACGDDVRLQRSMEELLDDQASDESFFLDRPLGDGATAAFSTATPPIGAQIGPYKLREQLGEGGMGVVYVAEQTEPVKRKVALKIIKPGMASKDVVARFEAERQALAMMDHPNIARVFDGGATESGQPYFVMELVCGVSLAQYCDEHALTTEQRLQIFLKVCRAVQHAHQKGIIHRDLKPSNVLVASIDDEAVPKVIDFGVAKAAGRKLTEETVYTQVSQLVGTPLYMSPEQVELGVADVDTRSDVYSLGVLLYELLTGSTPFDSDTLKQAGFDEMRRIIREDEPPKPSAMVSTLKADALSTISQRRGSDPRKLSESLSGELDWLAMKALEKDRNRRYESASALAADIERFLSGEALEACPPSITYRFQKLAGRHKALLTTAAIVFVTALLGIVSTSWQAWRATTALATAEQQRTNAVRNFERANNSLHALLAEIEATPQLQAPHMQPLRDRLVGVARDYYQQFIDEQQNLPELQCDLADAHLRLGDIAWTLGDNQVGDASHSEAVRIYESLVATSPKDDELRNALVLAALTGGGVPHDGQVGYLRRAVAAANGLTQPAHRLTAAKANIRLADALLSVFRVRTGESRQRNEAVVALNLSEQILTQLREEFPDNPEYAARMADLYELRAMQHYLEDNVARQREYNDLAIAILAELVEKHPDHAQYRKSLADLCGNIGRNAEAVQLLHTLVQQHPAVLSYQERLIDNYRVLGRQQLDYAQQAVEAARKLVERYPENIQYQAKLGLCLLTLGKRESKSGDLDGTISSLEEAIKLFEATDPYFRGHLGDAHVQLHEIAVARGDAAKAMVSISRAIENNARLQESEPNNIRFATAGVHHRLKLARLLRQTGNLENALAECEAAELAANTSLAETRLSTAPRESRFFARGMQLECQREKGHCLKALKRYPEAVTAFRAAINAEATIVRDIERSRVHESPNPLYDEFMSVCRASELQHEIESMLREELATWSDLEAISAFPDTCQLRQLEIQLRLAEHLLKIDHATDAARIYRHSQELLEALAQQGQIRMETIATCQHVISIHDSAELPKCRERSSFIEALRQQQNHEEASENEASATPREIPLQLSLANVLQADSFK